MLDKSYQHFVKNSTRHPDKQNYGFYSGQGDTWIMAGSHKHSKKHSEHQKKANISIKTSYLGVDALSQVIGTMRTPQVLEQH